MTPREVVFSFLFKDVCALINEALRLPEANQIDYEEVRAALREPEEPREPPVMDGIARACTNCWSLVVKPLDAGREQCQMCGHVQDEPVRTYRASA